MRRSRRIRTTFTPVQIAELEQHFLESRYLSSSRLAEVSEKLALAATQVKIWFKNRRRRPNVLLDHPNYFDCMPMSAQALNPNKAESNGSASSSSSKSSSGCSSGGPLSLQSLSINGSGESTPNALPPSPTPTTATTNLMENYRESAFNPYYYNNHYTSHHQQAHNGSTALSRPYASTAGAVGIQYYPPPPPGRLQHHQHQHEQHYHSPHPHQFQMQHKSRITIKQDADLNFNSPLYRRVPIAGIAPNEEVKPGVTKVEPSSAMSPDSEVFEPPAPKNDETSSICNANKPDAGDDLNETKTKLRVLVASKSNGTGHASSNRDSNGNEGTADSAIIVMENFAKAIAECQKLAGGDPNDPNSQSTMDTIMHAYNNHRNTSTNNQQFAYCYN